MSKDRTHQLLHSTLGDATPVVHALQLPAEIAFIQEQQSQMTVGVRE